jgi:twinkle protein
MEEKNKRPEEHGIKLKKFEHGTQKVKCPQCQPPHKMSDNPLSVTINDEGTVWFCHHCDWKGSYYNNSSSVYIPKKPVYIKPKTPQISTTEKMYQYFAKRGLTRTTVDKFQIFEEKGWYGFQYFGADDVLENIKYRTEQKGFRQSQGAKQILYNYKNVAKKETVVFVEGEMDVLSCSEVGFEATTLPNGAPKEAKYEKNDARYKALENCPLEAKKIILFTDVDQAGKALHKELLHRFGKDVCWYVKVPEGCKDANDVLAKLGAVELKKVIDEAIPYPIDGLYTANDYYSQIQDLYDGNYEKPIEIGMKGLDDIYKIMTGTFHTITGIPNHGKSIFLDQILLKLAINHGWKFAMFSPEHSTSMHIRRLTQMYLQKGFDEGFDNRMDKEELNKALAFMQEHFYFIETRDSVPNIDTILNIAKSSVFKYGINGLIIDPYNEVDAKRTGNAREDEHIRDFISLCKRFSRIYEITTWVVAHPTKLPKGNDGGYLPPTAYDISGAAHWHNQADAVLTVHRDFDNNTTSVITRKIREQDLYGKIGEAKFQYNFRTRDFQPYEKLPDNWDDNWND